MCFYYIFSFVRERDYGGVNFFFLFTAFFFTARRHGYTKNGKDMIERNQTAITAKQT